MDLSEIVARRKLVLEQAGAILAQETISGEEHQKAADMLAEAKKLGERASQLKEIADMGAQMATEAAQAKAGAPETKTERKEWANWGEFLQKAFIAQTRNVSDPRLRWFKDEAPAEQKDLIESVGASGGFLVPPEYQMQLQSIIEEQNTIRPRCTRIPMARRQVNIPVLSQTGTTANQPHWFGGMNVYWTEEAGAKSETTPSFREVTLLAHKLAAITYVSDELLEDSAISLAAFLSGPMGFGGAVAWYEEYAFLQGTGVGQPLGVIPAPCTLTVARANVSPAVQYVDLVNMLEDFLPSGNGVWYIHQSVMSTLLTMSGPSGNASYLWGSATSGQPGTLLGMPVVWTEKLPREGSAGDVLLADWRYYLLGDRQATTVDSSIHNKYEYDKTTWRVVHRVDGRPWLSAPLYLADGTSEISPFVILGAKST